VPDDARWEGLDASALASALALPLVAVHARTGSTLDDAHRLAAAGAPAGTLVLADEQLAGRGRVGRKWTSLPGAGIWLTLIERPNDVAALEVLSLRAGLAAARVLDRFAGQSVRVKWPNDLYVGADKLAGILIEARWRDQRPDWVAIGFGVNVLPPGVVPGAGLTPGTRRLEVLAELVPALRAAAAARGPLAPTELEGFAARDLARGRRCRQPEAGLVLGITARGELRVAAAAGEMTFRGGSLVLQEEA
jgi:BirA family transcriptional regulator, biotin operon repressor / biotin---[acetyl-CoA-carboxylase] ligase